MRAFATLVACLTLALPVRAESSIYDETQGVRAAGMGGAMRGVGTSNDTIYLNPAGLALAQRYSIDIAYAFSPYDDLNRVNASVVDSKSGPVAGGLGYTLVRGDEHGVDANLHRFYLGAAYPLTQSLAVGVMGRNIRGSFTQVTENGDERQNISLYTADAGVSLSIAQGIGVGFAMRNLVETDLEAFTPRQGALGVGFGADRLTLAADVAMDLSQDERRLSWFGGLEYLASQGLPVRLGFRREPYVKKSGSVGAENSLSGGLGFFTPTGSLDLAYWQSLDRDQNWSAIGSIKLFM